MILQNSREVFVAKSGSVFPVFFKVELTGNTDFDWNLFCGSIRRSLYLPLDFHLKLFKVDTNNPVYSAQDISANDKIIVMLNDD